MCFLILGPHVSDNAIATLNTFETGNPALKDLETACWVGNSRFVLENGQMAVETRISKVVPSLDKD